MIELAFLLIPVALLAYALGRRDGRAAADEVRATTRDEIFNQGYLTGIYQERKQHRLEGDHDIHAADWWKKGEQ